MLFGQGYSRRKLPWFDRYSVWALESFRGGGMVLPPGLLLLAALWVWDATNRSAVGTTVLWASVAAAVSFVVVVFVRGIRVWRGEVRHWKHVDSFWERKGAKGFPASQWLLMGVQVALLIAGLLVIGYIAR